MMTKTCEFCGKPFQAPKSVYRFCSISCSARGPRVPVGPRFWEKVAIAGSAECWLWTGASFRRGYGAFQLNGKLTRAHRISWSIANGPIPSGLCVLHSCDNPPCVNPAHLSIGTVQDNSDDMVSRGRHVSLRGEHHPMSKLSTSQVHDIKRLRTTGLSQEKVAAMFGITQVMISRIETGKAWTHLAQS